MSATNAKRHRQRPWSPPSIHDTFVHDAEGTVWEVRQVHRKDRQVHLYCPAESRHRFPFADELERDYTRVEEAT